MLLEVRIVVSFGEGSEEATWAEGKGAEGPQGEICLM